jgi:Domain of unknown function (DUF1906)
MIEGISTSFNCQDFGECLVQAGKQFVVRYHSARTKQPQKRVTPREAAILARAGLDLVTVYQDRARKTEDFSYARGQEDGRSAYMFANQIGQPQGSAIYFAVDEDFEKSDIDAFVLPYFRGVSDALNGIGSGTLPFKIGVYGSGLTCQLVKENHALAQLSWLAMATGWRGTATYSTWNMRQHAPASDLCGLGLKWERNEGRSEFGSFRPIGAELTADQGVAMRVTAPELYLRRVPTAKANKPIARLRQGQLVRVMGDAAPLWKRVRATLDGGEVIGFASGTYLASVEAVAEVLPAAPAAGVVPAVHFREQDSRSHRDSDARRAQPLGEANRPTRLANTAAELDAIVDWLAAESSLRYQPTSQATFCNVYAADFCYLTGAYLPRVWWKGTALLEIAKGVIPPVVYDGSVREMRADDLLAWLIEFGAAFGWKRVFDATALQTAANSGGIGLICTDRDAPGLPGHISVVVPETDALKAQRDPDGNVISPIQSQAGSNNFRRRKSNVLWWEDPKFRDWGFFVHG